MSFIVSVDWSAIASGATFESLVGQLLLHESRGTRCFSALGQDGGQDAVSEDGKTVYQAKYHQRPTGNEPIRDAKKELKSIQKYRNEDSPRYSQWRRAERWVLITNVPKKASTQTKWDTEIRPDFLALGLEAELWTSEDLEARLHDAPQVRRAYFEQETRVFVSLLEARAELVRIDPGAKDEKLPVLLERDQLVSELVDALSVESVVALRAGPGEGATRVAVTTAETSVKRCLFDNVLVANAENMVANPKWYGGIIPEQSTLLVLDEADKQVTAQLLARLSEELRTGRGRNWKILVTLRQHHEIGHLLQGLPFSEFNLEPLSEGACEQLAQEISDRFSEKLLHGQEDRARAIAEYSRGNPGWIVLVSRALATTGSIAELLQDNARSSEVIINAVAKELASRSVSALVLEHLPYALSVLGTFNSEDQVQVNWLQTTCEAGNELVLREALNKLNDARLIKNFGIRKRLWGLSTTFMGDVLSAAYLTTTSSADDKKANHRAIALLNDLASGLENEEAEVPTAMILETLAKVQYAMQAGNEVEERLKRLFSDSMSKCTPTKAMRLHELLQPIAQMLPTLAADFSFRLNVSEIAPEQIEVPFLGTRIRTVDGTVARLPALLRSAAMGVRSEDEAKEVFRALLQCAERDAQLDAAALSSLHNRDKSAKRAIERVIESLSPQATQFSRLAKAEVERRLASTNADPANCALVEWLAQPLVAPDGIETTANKKSMTMTRYQLSPDSFRGKLRRALLDTTWKLLEGNADNPWRITAWNILAASRARMLGSLDPADSPEKVLTRIKEVLERQEHLDAKEGLVARKLWNWHLERGEPIEKQLAASCESRYQQIVRRNEAERVLLANDRPLASIPGLASEDPNEIADFLGDLLACASRLDDDHVWHFLSRLVCELGETGRREVAETWFRLFSELPTQGPPRDIALSMFDGVLGGARRNGDIGSIWDRVASDADEHEIELLVQIYGSKYSAVTQEAVDRLLPHTQELAARHPKKFFRVLGWIGVKDPSYRRCLTEAWPCIDPEEAIQAFCGLLDGTYHATHGKGGTVLARADLEWLFDQLVEVPSADRLGGNDEWVAVDLVTRFGKLSFDWLLTFLERRQNRASAAEYDSVPYSLQIDKLVDGSTATEPAFSQLIAIVRRDRLSHPPPWLRRLDTPGEIVATCLDSLIDEALSQHGNPAVLEGLNNVSPWVAILRENSEPWRRVALRVCGASEAYPSESRIRIYSALGDRGVRSYSGAVGEVAQSFFNELSRAEQALESESEEALAEYWKWRVRVAKRAIAFEEQRIEEEFG